jgi:hypothetical protein
MDAMVWAVLVAIGVAVVSMTLFGARITRRPPPVDRIVDDIEISDPSDPWAAWKPRPFEELDRPRPRLWPVGAALTGLVLVGAGFAGARQTLWTTAAAEAPEITTPRPYIVQVDIPPTPTLKPTPQPTPTPVPATPAPQVATPATAAPAAPAATTAAEVAGGSAPTLTGNASCSGGLIRLSYTATANGSDLSWLAVYVDGKVTKGGAISGASHSSSWQGSGSAGDHALEVSVEDDAGRTSRKQFQVRCG